MYRFATLAGLVASVVAIAPAASAAEAPLPDSLQLALIRPALPTTPDLVEPAALHPDGDVAEAPRQPSLAARAALAPKVIVKVDIGAQRMRVIVDGTERYSWKVSTAGRGYVTPTGQWTPYRMHTMWYSRKYDNAPMPHAIFFTGGYAIHATPHVRRLGSPASHGCVRLHPDNAKALFALAKEYGRDSMRVVIKR
ncbi:L,D-transpeptidase [Oharaeibacter diazotrophicus]|uniref:Lipoprotein-anchoring transpeptidase ErfK/SrfK n=1 Tax=Oharaeibacter diazotrophicus TaxID=1920512 RepID=A0A4V3CWK9_9HYPH|nr:lipoprotein-anchoring transpeptidase ErfK/SrfK [Oharaeibacter diazotrophicus]BBE71279.1 hypothetical protein OHA_1_00850 [Pleomorphomonas sp. SM30]GLS78034.1 hypothetical protein GCM10007904_33710 [Oharaeibacter diazotrophicus]